MKKKTRILTKAWKKTTKNLDTAEAYESVEANQQIGNRSFHVTNFIRSKTDSNKQQEQ